MPGNLSRDFFHHSVSTQGAAGVAARQLCWGAGAEKISRTFRREASSSERRPEKTQPSPPQVAHSYDRLKSFPPLDLRRTEGKRGPGSLPPIHAARSSSAQPGISWTRVASYVPGPLLEILTGQLRWIPSSDSCARCPLRRRSVIRLCSAKIPGAPPSQPLSFPSSSRCAA